MSDGLPDSVDYLHTAYQPQLMNSYSACTYQPLTAPNEMSDNLIQKVSVGSSNFSTNSVTQGESDSLPNTCPEIAQFPPVQSIAHGSQISNAPHSNVYSSFTSPTLCSNQVSVQEQQQQPERFSLQASESTYTPKFDTSISSQEAQTSGPVELSPSNWAHFNPEFQRYQPSTTYAQQQNSLLPQSQNVASVIQPPTSYFSPQAYPTSTSQDSVAPCASTQQAQSQNSSEFAPSAHPLHSLSSLRAPPPQAPLSSLQPYCSSQPCASLSGASQPRQQYFSPLQEPFSANQSPLSSSQATRPKTMSQFHSPPQLRSQNQASASSTHPTYAQFANSDYLQSSSQPRHPQMVQRYQTTSARAVQEHESFVSVSSQHLTDRTPGAALSSEEWNALNGAVSLLHDSNFLPNDGPEKPRCPNLSTQVNCHPDYIRCTLTTIPVTSKLQSKCRLPLGLLVHPFRDVNDLPVIQPSVIVRCRSCRTYINPFVKFTDNCRRWRCPVCLLSNIVPDDFFFDPATQTYGDPSRRPEIRSATVEFIAPSEYMLRPPQAATYVFCLEVSRAAVTTGYLELVCNLIADQLMKIPGGSRRQVAILTFDSGVQFYVLSGKKMRMVICQDLSEVFLPDLNGMVNRINDCAQPIIDLLRQLPSEFANTQATSNCLGFVLQTALKLIGGTGGRVTVFNTSIPSVGPGALECRETHEDLTKPEAEHLRPASDFYRTIALDFVAAQISVDLFMLNSNYCDIATISGVARFSGGGVDLLRYLIRKIGFEAVLRLRCTRGLTVQNFYGNFFMRSVDLLILPIVNPDAGYAMQLEINERLDSFSTVIFQVALLYTSAFGDRRIRVHTLCIPVTNSPETIFNHADEGAVACLVAKMAVERTISSSLSNAREALTTVMGDILSAYQNERNRGTSHSSLSDICPASLRLLPSYLCGALRFAAFRNHISTSLDVRSGALELLIGASTHRVLSLIYPRLYAVNSLITEPVCGKNATLAQKFASLSLKDEPFVPLPCLPLTGKSITRDGVFLLDTGSLILLLVGYGIPASDLQSLIGYSNIEELTVEKSLTKLADLPEGEKPPPPRKRLQALVKSIQRDRSLGTALVLIRHDVPEPLKSRFINALVEDRTSTAPSYPEYVQMILSGRS
ncbi:Protein transport protein Sec24B [Echinococcus granulosus]|uniref:Protein transport protein Sec24B n=1 Tax=Echinococcus granulosus TaxID=6210 RepID=A0A068WDR4_ECHGR|nr:Protein transport protein Sec24B [Echinococcus granulosus]CDS15775.1 protein transport protein Sec24B [Echinococcus granulosus]